jgi:hypothetical protein
LYWPLRSELKLVRVGVKMNFGGRTNASPGGLNAVVTIQKIGSRIKAAPMSSATTVKMFPARRRRRLQGGRRCGGGAEPVGEEDARLTAPGVTKSSTATSTPPPVQKPTLVLSLV